MADEGRKLHIDDDWKSEAAAEKEKIAEAVEQRGGSGPLPEASFAALAQMLAMQAMIGLGGYAAPNGQEIPPNMELAKHHIDLLDVLEQKTAGNLTPDEKKMLDTLLHQLRMAYVQMMSGR